MTDNTFTDAELAARDAACKKGRHCLVKCPGCGAEPSTTDPLMCMPQSAFESALAKARSAALAEAVKELRKWSKLG